MKTMKKRLQKWILGGLTVGFVCSAALGVGLTFVGENAVANEEKEPILAPRYIYDTSLNDAIFGVGSKILAELTLRSIIQKTKTCLRNIVLHQLLRNNTC